jgi:hypothetical protein
MMLEVLVLAGSRQEGLCCHVLFSGFVGWFQLGCLGFLPFLGFVGYVLFRSSFFFCFGVIFVYSSILRGVYVFL